MGSWASIRSSSATGIVMLMSCADDADASTSSNVPRIRDWNLRMALVL